MNCIFDFYVGGTTESQREFLEALSAEDLRRNQDRQRKQPPIANDFALGYTYHDVLDADHEGMRTASYPQYLLIPQRYPSTPLRIPTRRSLAVLYTPPPTPFNTTNYPQHSHCCTTRLVTTVVLAEATARLDTASEDTPCLAGWGLQGEDGRSHDWLAG